jgi:restriction-modification enzyme MmeI-like protein
MIRAAGPLAVCGTSTSRVLKMVTALPPAASAELSQRLEAVISMLGFDGTRGLVRRWVDFQSTTNRHVVRQAFDTIRVHAVFGFPSGRAHAPKFFPILYLAIAADDAEAVALHRLVWSQGVVPILLVGTPSGLQIRRGLTPSNARPVTVAWDRLADSTNLPPELTSLTAIALSSSVVWRDFEADRSNRVDAALLKAIESLNDVVRHDYTTLRQQPALVNALIGRFLYFFVLLGRKIIGRSWIGALKDQTGKALCPQIASSIDDTGRIDIADRPWPAREVWSLFDKIDEVLNGAIFPISASERRLIPADTLHLVRRAIRHGDTLGRRGRQLGFLDVSFSTLRTETISAIYELFLLIEDPEKKDDEGAFYTPPFLVDYVLDEVNRIRAFTGKSRVLDPAAGSGIFLVGAYRRILEREMPRRRWTPAHFQKARLILETAIFGIEKNRQAANVARFSLYLTLLDYVENGSIKELKRLAGSRRVFPGLADNVLDRDLFSITQADLKQLGRFSHIVGNPPWGSFGEQTGRSNVERSAAYVAQRNARLKPARDYVASLDPVECPVSNKRLSELFIWKVQRDLVQKNGVFGLLISTRSYVAPSAEAFPNALAKRVKLVGLANLSHFRYRLFRGARNPTLAIFAENREPNDLDSVWVYSPLLTSQPIGEAGHLWSIIVSESDIEPYKLRDLSRSQESWFWALMLRPIDRRFANYLRLWSRRFKRSFGDFLSVSNLVLSRGGSTSQTGVPSRLLLRSENYQARLGMNGLGLADYPHHLLQNVTPRGSFAKLFGGHIVFIPRHMNEVLYIEHPVGFVSTFNAIYAQNAQDMDAGAIAGLRGIARYLTSDVARYLYALFGKTRILDSARLEKGDLESVPFPFENLADSELQHLDTMEEEDITRLFAGKVGIDESFMQAVREYRLFREGYEDSQVPAAALSAPDEQAVEHYKSMLSNQLADHFGAAANLQCVVSPPSEAEHFAIITLQIGRSQHERADTEPSQLLDAIKSNMGFSPHARILFDAARSRVAVAKPWTRVAWTVEQAYADARGISEEVLRSGVA